MEEFLSLIANLGFPIAVAAYLLIRFEAKLGELTRAISELRECIITLPGRIYSDGSRAVYVAGDKTTGSNTAYPPT
mgnify:CR=1 FL=1|jgi:hypothetical protein